MSDLFSHSSVARAVVATLGMMAAATAAAQSVGNAGDAATLPTVSVRAQRETLDSAPPAYAGGQVGTDARLGILGNMPVLDTPFSVTGYTSQAIRNEQARSVADILAFDPSVRMASARSNINEDFTIRGFAVPSGDFALNGVFGLTPFWRAPLEAVEQVEVLKGPSAALFGMPPAGSIGGVVNLVPKRASDEPLTRLDVSAMSDSVYGTHLDVGRRFGPDNAFGARVNLMHRQGDTTIHSQSTRESLGALGLDLRERSFRASLDLLWQAQRIDNVVRQFGLASALTALPAVPNNAIAYPGLGYSDGNDTSALFKAEYDLSSRATAFVSLGQRKLDWNAIAANPVIQNSAGDYIYSGGWQKMDVDSKPLQFGVHGSFVTGAVEHAATLSYDRLDQKQTLGFYTGFPGGTSNLSAGSFSRPRPSAVSATHCVLPDTKLTSVALADTMSMLKGALLVTLGARQQQVEAQNYSYMTARYDRSATTPLAGVVYKLQPQLSLYGSYVEGLSPGDTAPVSGISNPGEMMPPYHSKQKSWVRSGTRAAS
ncbi:MAG: TonB-dependent receptor [Aquabacterium sp.]